MATQSRLPVFLLTRPPAQSQRFAAALHQRFGPDLRVVTSPLILPEFPPLTLPEAAIDALIFTSETGVEAYRRLSPDQKPAATLAYCVGARTALAARSAGLEPVSADGDALDLLALIRADAPRGRLLHLRGYHARVDIAAALSDGGLACYSVVAYRQREQPLTPAARQSLSGETPIWVPLFSPRSATLFLQQIARFPITAPLNLFALSGAVAQPLKKERHLQVHTAARPTAEAMLDEIAARYNASQTP